MLLMITMRIRFCFILFLFCVFAKGQYPYVKKLNYPEQLPTQVVYDMLTDSKGYIWLGTDKGLYRFNGRAFVFIPIDKASMRGIGYLQEDADGVIWCMNFYNQLFYFNRDTLRNYVLDTKLINNASTFNNVVVGSEKIWFNSFANIFQFNKKTHALEKVIFDPSKNNRIISLEGNKNELYAFSSGGYLFFGDQKENHWDTVHQTYLDVRLVSNNEKLLGVSMGLERTLPFEIKNHKRRLLKQLDISPDVYILKMVFANKNDCWFCTQSGAYQWNPETGETKCYLPNERVSDVTTDYQGNYWFSTLDNGVFVCSSLANTLIKIYDDPLLDNFSRLQSLSNDEIVAGNSQALMSKLNLNNREVFHYDLTKLRETEFIYYDSISGYIFSNRGVFQKDKKTPIELYDYSKGLQRDIYGNLIVSLFNGAYIMNDHYNSYNRSPLLKCALYKNDSAKSDIRVGVGSEYVLRKKRSLTCLSSQTKDGFWISYSDDLYDYHYDGNIIILKDAEGQPVIGRSLIQLADGSLAVGESTKGVMIFKNDKIVRSYNEKNGLSSNNVRKIIKQDNYIWVLTDAGLDRINDANGNITSYLEEYGLSNIIINDFIIVNNKLVFATPTGILQRYNVPRYSNFEIRFPLLKATSNGREIGNKESLPDDRSDISFYFEALHYISPESVIYLYRLKGVDSAWHHVNSFNNQLIFNRLSPGKYEFEIQAISGANYKSKTHHFLFTVPKPIWQTTSFLAVAIIGISLLIWLILRQWEYNLLKRQTIKEELLKSQLVAMRAQMNPHFIYNVLNTVQGLVYGNRKTEAGALLGNFSDLMRKTLNSSDKQLLPLKEEIENIRLYLELEKARFDEGFEYHIDALNITDLSEIRIPSLMLQPFIENAVKHGLMHKAGMKKVDIRFEQTGTVLQVTIDDNGIGRQQSMEINQRSKNKPSSFATAALNERMDLFNRLYKQQITCEIIDKKDERQNAAGTKVILYIPDYGMDAHAL